MQIFTVLNVYLNLYAHMFSTHTLYHNFVN